MLLLIDKKIHFIMITVRSNYQGNNKKLGTKYIDMQFVVSINVVQRRLIKKTINITNFMFSKLNFKQKNRRDIRTT